MNRPRTIKVTPAPALQVGADGGMEATPLLEPAPLCVLGNDRTPPLIQPAVRPGADACFGPRGACLLGPQGPLLVCDTGHHRLLGWNRLPTVDRTPADWQIGQPGFGAEGRNGRRAPGAASLNVPTGICTLGHGIAVGDAWNHRVLIWNEIPTADNTAADLVLGQADFTGTDANRGRPNADADGLNWPYGVHSDGERLLVADAGNRRVLVWDRPPRQNGQPADRVLGQHDFDAHDENAGGEPNAMSMRWPHGIALWRGRLCVADAGNNRIQVWEDMPREHGAPCDWILGQTGVARVDHNQSLYWPRANTLNMPYGIGAAGDWLLAADTANSRLLAWHVDDLADGAPARRLAGQPDFHAKGDNRWRPPAADSFCWPYGLHVCANMVAVADSGNNRVSLWRLGT